MSVDEDLPDVLFRAKLQRQDSSSWGFRLQGGLEYDTPLTLLKVFLSFFTIWLFIIFFFFVRLILNIRSHVRVWDVSLVATIFNVKQGCRKWEKEVPIWYLVLPPLSLPFTFFLVAPSPFLPSFIFPSLPFIHVPFLSGVPSPDAAREFVERCELHQWIWVQPGHQTVSNAL